MKEKLYSVFAYRRNYSGRDPYDINQHDSYFDFYLRLNRHELIEKLAELKSSKIPYTEIIFVETVPEPEYGSVEYENLDVSESEIRSESDTLANTKITNREEAERLVETEKQNKRRLQKEADEKRHLEELLKKYPR